jgi:hypothetical protein
MKHFKKTKQLVEGKSLDRQERDKINDITGDLKDQQREKELGSRLKPSGEIGDQQMRAPVNPDGSPVSLDNIQDRKPEKGPPPGDAPPSGVGIGTHGNQKRGGIFNRMYRGANTLDSMWQVAKKGMPMRPVKDDIYEDEEGNLRRFGKVTTGRAGGNPYYFEFDHYDKASDQNLVLYGIAPGANMQGAELQPIQLKVKAIVPRDKMDVRPMTVPNSDNTQSNFVSEAKKFSKTGAIDATTVDSGGNMTTGTMKQGPDGRFITGNQSGVQFAPGGNADKNELAVVASGAIEAIGGKVPSLKQIMRSGGSRRYGPSSSSDDDDTPSSADGGSGGETGGGYATIHRQYRPDYKKQDNDGVSIPKNLWYHPTIQRTVKRFIAMDKGERRVKIGSFYGMLVRRDPADKDSDYKLVRKIPRSHIPKIFLDDDFIAEIQEIIPIPPNLGGPGIAKAAIPALGHVVQQKTGIGLSASRQEAMKAISKTGSQLNIANKPTPLEIPGRASGGNEIKIPTPSKTPAGLPLKENMRLTTLIGGVDLNEGFASWLGSMVGSGIKITRSIAGKTKRIIKSAAKDFEKSSGIKLNKVDYSNLLSMIANEIKHPWGGDHTARQGPAWADGKPVKGGPEDVDLDPDNNVDFVGDTRPDPEGRPEEPTPEPAPEDPSSQEPDNTEQEEPEPGEDDQTGMSDEKLTEYITSLINGYTKCTLAKPSAAAMLNNPTKDIVQEADILDALGRMVNTQTTNAFRHFAGWGFWPDITEQDLKVLYVDTDYEGRNMGPKHGFAYEGEKDRQSVRDQFKNKAIKIRTELGEYYNVNTWKQPTGQLIGLSNHDDLIWSGDDGEFFKRPDPNNPPKYWKYSSDKYTAPEGLSKYDSVLQFLARDIYTRYKVNILSPSYKFKLKHFKEQVPDDPMDHDINIDPGKMQTTPTGANSKPKQGKFFDKGNSSPGQFGHDLGKKVDAAKQAKQKQQDKDKQKKSRLRRGRRGKKRLEESFNIVRKLVTGN